MDAKFNKWKNILWRTVKGKPVAFCPQHKHRLDIINEDGDALAQDTNISSEHLHLLCPVDSRTFSIDGGSFWVMRRRYNAANESDQLKDATYRDLDNIYTPVLKVSPKPKDDRYSIQVEIDNTPDGKKMVIYAMDRNEPESKTQIFIDPEKEKMTFDSNDLHPNMIFSKIEATFKDSKKSSMEKSED